MQDTVIRPAALPDLPAITAIYNHAILHTTATFDTEPKTDAEQMAWFKAHGERHPSLVATVDGQVVGWASLSAWSDRCAYSDTAEVSTYVDADYRGRGIGNALGEAIDRETHKELRLVFAAESQSAFICAICGKEFMSAPL
jgi:L-amino acid N-acyltransferase